jgi:hypothetical protein
MWYHLSRVEYFYSHDFSLFEIKNKALWHYIWGSIFKAFDVEDVLFRAKVIHVVQTLISFFVMYFTSKVIIKHLFKDIEHVMLKFLSLWSVIIWFTIYATYSVAYHQVWIMWYSINYQITLIMFWYITALTIMVAEQKHTKAKRIFYLSQILFFSIVILWMHAIEFIYYLMYLFLILFLYSRQFIDFCKRYIVQVSIFLLTISYCLYYFLTHKFIYREPKLFGYLSNLDDLFENIIQVGKLQVQSYSRSFASLNELIYLSLALISIMLITVFINKRLKVNIKLFLFLFISSFFVLIPISNLASGIASMLVNETYVNRFYYSSSIFMVLPVFVYYIMSLQNLKDMILKVNMAILSILILVLLYSKIFSDSSNYYKNVLSLINSLSNEKVGVNYSTNYVNIIKKQLGKYKQQNMDSKVFYYARGDISYIIKYILKEDNIFIERRKLKSKIEFLIYCKKNGFKPIVFKTPDNFPKDKILFKTFDFEMK